MKPKEHFWNKIARKYAAQPVADEASYQRKLADTQAYFRPDMRIIEFGCGTGTTAITHAPHVAHVLATDVAENMLEIGREKAAAAGVDNIAFMTADLENFTSDERFDAVLCLSLLHLLEDHRAALARAYDLLTPGGILVTSTVCLADMSVVFRLIAPVARWWFGIAHLRHLGSDALLQDIAAAGFEIETSYRPGKGHALFAIARKPG